MEINIYQSKNEDGARSEEMYIDGKYSEAAYPMCECPEDDTLERDLIYCSRIAKFMEIAFNAEKSGETFNILTKDSEEE